ncbi:MAG TPA: hypothetical protein VGB10_05515 [Bacteroidota bacterium]
MDDSLANRVKSPTPPNLVSLPDSFDAISRSLKEAQSNAGEIIDRYYTIAGKTIRLRFAGPALIPYVTRALEHSSVEPVAQPDLTINVWDSASTRSKIPDIAWFKSYRQGTGVILSVREGSHCMAYQSNTGVLSFLDIAETTGYYWVADAKRLPYYEVARPMSLLLHWWFHHEGYQMLHAAAIGLDGKGIVLAGKGGSGKSSTSLHWLEAGLGYAGDDYCLIDIRSQPTIYSIYNSAMLFPKDIPVFPSLTPFVADAMNPTDEKRLLFIHERNRVCSSFRFNALFLPRVTEQEKAKLFVVSPSEAMKALAPSTLLQLPGARANAFHAMSTLVRKVPSYRLELGTDRQHGIQLIREFLESLS